jgi:hypothetical protein
MYMRFGVWNVRSLYRTGLLKTVATELGKYKFWRVKYGTEWAVDCTVFYGEGNEDHHLGTGFLPKKQLCQG